MKSSNNYKRIDGRSQNQLRPIKISTGTNPYAEGSAEVELGSTKLLITSSIDRLSSEEEDFETGRIVAALKMLPRSMHIRIQETDLSEIVQQELGSLEHLIARALWGAVSSETLPGLNIKLDCTVVCSDAGIASAAIAGCWAALYQSLDWAMKNNLSSNTIGISRVAALSGGIVDEQVLVDLCAEEAADASFTVNVIFDENQRVLDVRGSCEQETLELPKYISLMEMISSQAPLIFAEEEKAVL